MNKNELLKKLGKNVKIERIKKDMTQEQLSTLLGVSQNYIACIERGRENMSLGKILELANALNVKIEKILDELSDDTAMILLNAVYFKGEWSSKFDEYSTQKLPFYNLGTNEIKVDTMRQIEYFPYYEDKKVKAIELRFKEDFMSAIIILPSEGTDINKFIDTLSISNDEYSKIINGLKTAKVHIQLPKFELDFNQNLNEILMDLGMYNAFSAYDADFTGLRKLSGLFINRVVHKTYLKVFEDGCEAAGVTVVDVTDGALPEIEKIYDMKVNRPFLFLLKNYILPEEHNLIFMSKIEKLE